MVAKLPSVNVPFTDSKGRISPIWHEFLRSFVAQTVAGTITGGTSPTTITAGNGLTSTGTSDLILTVGQGSGIAVNANDVNVDINSQTSAQPTLEDEVLISDVSDNNAIRKTTVRGIAELASNPGGLSTYMQYNNSGIFGGDSGFTYNGEGTATLSTNLYSSTIQVGLNEQGTNTIRFDSVTGSGPARIQADGSGGYTLHAKASGSTEAKVFFDGANPTITYTVGASTGTMVISSTVGVQLTGTTMPLRRTLLDNVTASTTQTQGQGALTADYNNVTTVANSLDTVTLPAGLAGRYCVVRNTGANTLQVFPASGATLGLGTNTATTINAGDTSVWFAKSTTIWYQIAGKNLQQSLTAGITASTTQTQGQGALTSDVNEVSTVANANDTVTLPTAPIYSRSIVIINNGANTLQIFPASGDNLGAGVNTSTTLASGSNVRYTNYNSTNWEAV